MQAINLRKFGRLVMLALPPAVLEILKLRPGAKVGLTIHNSQLVVEPNPRRRYTLDELLAQCKPAASRTKEERKWSTNRAAGNEII